jgi:hypothetical protein
MKSGWLIFGIIGAVILFLLYRSSSTTTVITSGAAVAGPSNVSLIPLTSSALGAIGNVLGQSQSGDSTDDGADFDLSEASGSSSDTFDL